MDINTVTVIGATGTMGRNVAGIFASFGHAKVYMIGRDIEKVKRTIPQTIRSVRADSIIDNLIPADFSMLEECAAKSDLVFESALEDIEIKKEIASSVGAVIRKDTFFCTGSSGLSITDIADGLPAEKRGHFFGVHLFNPPYNMSLCEFIRTPYSDDTSARQLKRYLEQTLYRTVVEVKDSPAFLANRIGFQFINEAMQYADLYKDNGGIDYIDSLLGVFTGRAMPPLTTSDFVGLDVHASIVDNIYKNTNDYAHATFVLPQFVSELIKSGKLGKKSQGGLYQQIRYENGLKRNTVYDISSGQYRDNIPYVFPFAEKMKKAITNGDYSEALYCLVSNHSLEAEITLSFLLKYIIYSLYISEEIAFVFSSADDVMAMGFNWCPPLAMKDALSFVTDIKALAKERLPELYSKIDLDHILRETNPSRYDFRPYFKSGRISI